eukprot:gene35569-46132_t
MDTADGTSSEDNVELYDNPLSSNGEMVMAIVVGTVVTIVAILMWFMIMTLSRALLAFLLNHFGLSGIALILGLVILVTMKFGQPSI